MVDTRTPICGFGWKAPDFALTSIDGRVYRLADVRGPKGTLVMFICNHCPFVRAIVKRLVRDVGDLGPRGIGAVAIMSNDYRHYPDDAPDRMREFAAEHGFCFPYLIDETQAAARAYDAVCTPDFFGFNADLELQYRGRLDEGGRQPVPPGVRRELFEAMRQVAETGQGPEEQHSSIGCSIKWRD
jgi:peroxiredoxin